MQLSAKQIVYLIEHAEDDEVRHVAAIIPNDQETFRALATIGQGYRYDSPKWEKLVGQYTPGGWYQYWPIVDGDMELTGEIIDSQDDYANVGDEAMILITDLPVERQQEIAEDDQWDGYA